MRNLEEIRNMSNGDYACGIIAHYKPLAKIVNDNNFKYVLEIGCAYGNNAEYLLKNTGLEELYSVDPYLFYTQMPGFTCQKEYDILYKYAFEKLDFYKSFVLLYRGNSINAYEFFMEEGFDFDLIFIDGDHSYDTVKWEIPNYYNLVKKDGILCGHDYNIFESVTNAVNEMAEEMKVGLTIHEGNIWAFDRKP